MPRPTCSSHLTEPLLQHFVFPLKVLQFLLGDFQTGFCVLQAGRDSLTARVSLGGVGNALWQGRRTTSKEIRVRKNRLAPTLIPFPLGSGGCSCLPLPESCVRPYKHVAKLKGTQRTLPSDLAKPSEPLQETAG